MKKLTSLIFLFLGWVILALPTWAAVTSVTATVDKNPAMADESITLTVTANGDADRNAFDPSALLKDFVVGRTSISSQTKMVNFNTTRSTVWSTILIPRREGRFTIPAFNVGGQSTQPINIMIVPVSQSNNAAARDLYITTEVDNSEVYLQQQVKYTVKLHLAQDLQRGSLEAPKLENADIRQIGKDKEYSDIINGKRYRIIERTFAIIPQQSGKFTVSGPLFQGEVLDNTRQSFGFFNRTKTVNRVGPAIEINVQPIPTEFSGHWLPSEFVQLNEEWQPSDGNYVAGEPITRTITLTAVGLVEEQLPEVAGQYPADLKTYPDQASTTTIEKDETLIAQRVESVAIIPGKQGQMVIPEVTLPWFNVVTKQTEIARLPARTIDVAPAQIQNQVQLPVNQPSELALPASPTVGPQLQVPGTEVAAFTSWWSISSWVFLFLWLSTLVAWRLQMRGNNKPEKVKISQDPDEGESWKTLQKALKSNDAKVIVAPLSRWLGHLCGSPDMSLPSSQNRLQDAALNNKIKAMFDAQYSRSTTPWNSDALKTELNRMRESKRNPKSDKFSLGTMYPSTSN